MQRLVDGELVYVEIRQLMQAAENNPELWRQIAAAFVEDQIWRAEFADEAGTCEAESTATPALASRPPAGPAGHMNGVRWLSMAAMLTLAVTVGFLGGRGDFSSRPRLLDPDGVAGTNRSVPDVTSPAAPIALAQNETRNNTPQINPAFYHMQLEDPQGNRYLDSEIPLYPVNQSTDLRRLGPGTIPREVQEQARNSGYQVQQDVRYVSGQLNDGRRFIIPIRNYRFSPNQ